jgi:hypothetical protein
MVLRTGCTPTCSSRASSESEDLVDAGGAVPVTPAVPLCSPAGSSWSVTAAADSAPSWPHALVEEEAEAARGGGV